MKSAIITILPVFFAGSPLLSQEASVQPWTNTSGVTIQGEFVRLEGETLIIRKDGNERMIPIAQLSPESAGQAKQMGANDHEKPGVIGAVLDKVGDAILIKGVVPGSGADKAGLRVGNRLISVGGKAVQGMELSEVIALLRGKVGTTVSLTVSQDLGVSRNLEIVRGEMKTAGSEQLAGTYDVKDDPSLTVVIERGRGGQFSLKCPQQHWSGTGWVGEGREHAAFKGIFRMEDHPDVAAGLRGAVGYMRIDYQLGDQLRVRTKFNFYDSGDDKMRDKILIRQK